MTGATRSGRRIVSLHVPSEEWLDAATPHGWARLAVGDRLRVTQRTAAAMGRAWLPPYVPRAVRGVVPVGGGRDAWRTVDRRYVEGTAVRALRWYFGDSEPDATRCPAVACLSLVASWKEVEPATRWADVGDVSAWPVRWRVDAKRLADRMAVLADGTWCVWCDNAPWASAALSCLWCEQTTAPAWRPAAKAAA